MFWCIFAFDTLNNMATKVLILGHSFISRFYDFLRFNVWCQFKIKLKPKSEKVFLRGYPGAKIDYIKERCLHMVGSLEPTVVLLQVGSNDLCRLDKSVQEIEQKWIGLVLTLKYCYHVQRVAVLQILHRQWPRRRIRYPVDIPWFNDRVDTLNTFLRNYFKEDRVEGVQFWRHPENQELVDTDDKVHLNEVYGYTK
jgi:hypothetical protein